MEEVTDPNNKPMSWEGVGPRMALVLLPFLAAAAVARLVAPRWSAMGFIDDTTRRAIGWGWLGLGLILWVSSAMYFVRHFTGKELLTGGPFAWCRNPIYASAIIFVLPSVALLWNAWPVLVADAALYLAFRRFIAGEYSELARRFGARYIAYRDAVPELFPVPPLLMHRRAPSRGQP